MVWAVSPAVALSLFVAAVLFLLAGVLLAAGRRRRESLVLAIFMGLVGVNFLATGLEALYHPPYAFLLGRVSLALDPLFLLLFVHLYAPQGSAALARGLMAVSASLAAIAIALSVLAPNLGFRVPSLIPDASLGLTSAMLNLAVCYGAAWAHALRAALAAPTRLLGQRATWLAGAIGVAVIPRLALVPADFNLFAALGPADPPYEKAERAFFLVALLQMGIIAAILALTYWYVRRKSVSPPVPIRRALRFVALAVLFLVALSVPFTVSGYHGGPHFGWTGSFGLRWIVFAGVLVYGMLRYEVPEFQRTADRAVPVAGAVLGAVAVFLVATVYGGAQDLAPSVYVPLAAGLALAAAWPAADLTRTTVRYLEGVHPSGGELDRRLELYRAALESAWARGPPNATARVRLDRERRAFGLSRPEARALEHVVVTSVAAPPERLGPGDEPVPGLLLEKFLGEGAHGRVFAARRFPKGDPVVVKAIASERLGGRQARQRLRAEVRALERLSHPGIVPMLELHTTGKHHLLVMGRIDAQPLSAHLAGARWRQPQVRRLVEQLLDALAAAHRHGVVHGDIKPSNLLLGQDGRLRITDFGAALVREDAKALENTITGLGSLGAFAGTLAYMAPEQVRGHRASPQSDVYATALVAYELLTGKPAFDLHGSSFFDAMDMVGRPQISLRQVPAAWRPFLSRALAPDPGQRFSDAAAMRHALRKLAP